MSLAPPQIRLPEQWLALHCEPLGPEALWPRELAEKQLLSFDGWHIVYDETGRAHSLNKRFDLADFDAVKLAVRGVSELADEQDHHPLASFSYNFIEVVWNTHDAQGVSANDWICAAHTDALIRRLG